MNMIKLLFTLLISFGISIGHAESTTPLSAEKAFALTVSVNQDKQLLLKWSIAPGYYLYKDKIHVIPADANTAQLSKIVLPKGEEKKDELHGVFESYSNALTVWVPYTATPDQQLNLKINYQGCSSEGFCYPPITDVFKARVSDLAQSGDVSQYVVGSNATESKTNIGQQDKVAKLLEGKSFFFIVIGFMGFGLLLAFTPCVLPMVPILSSIVVGYGNNISTRKAFSLSLAYVLGMALSYANAGMLVALLGSRIQSHLQNPWVIGIFCILFVLLALSLFELIEIRLPNKIHQRVVSWAHRHEGGTYVGVFFMGGFSTLVVSPCISAPLVGVLSYIAETGSVVFGGIALLSLGLGMGLPLLLIGTSAGKLLPRSGPWMHCIKQAFGFMMLGLAVWMLSRIVPSMVSLFLWSIWTIALSVFVWRITQSTLIWRFINQSLAIVLFCYGVVLFAGGFFGYSDPLNPFGKFSNYSQEKLPFVIVKNMQDVENELVRAKQSKKQVLLDFYADWCVSCIVMDKQVFSKPNVQKALSNFILLRADVTKNSEFDKALLNRYNVIAPPTMVFFDLYGNPIKQVQAVGEMDVAEFLAKVEHADKINSCLTKSSTC